MIHLICTTKDGTEVYANLINSTVSNTIARHPQLISLLKEALVDSKLSDPEVRLERDMGRGIGYDFIVDAPSEDTVFYAQVLGDSVYTRFVKISKPVATNFVAAVMRRTADGKAYELCDARIGRLVPPRPGSVNEAPSSKPFWKNHAFVQGNQVLQLRTVTKTCPY